MRRINRILFVLSTIGVIVSSTVAEEVQPTWQSMADQYTVPQWFQDGKIGVWFHWGISSAADENRPNDGSHYGRRMYSPPPEGKPDEDLNMNETLTKWHTERYGHPSEFGYEDLIPLFKAEKWDPDALVKFVQANGACFIMPVACHHDNFDMYDSFHPWNAVEMGPKRDTLKEWRAAARKHGLKFGVSTHLYWSPRFFANARKHQQPGSEEWTLFNMDFDPRGYATQDSWNEHWYDRCWEIISKYDPDMFNVDSPYPKIDGGKGLGLKLFANFLNRDLKENDGKQTVVLSFKDSTVDRAAFTYNLERGGAGDIKPEPWMWATDLSGGWFYRKTAVNRMSIPVMVGNAVDAISKNGVVMLNIALKGDGTIPENQAAYLTSIGDFLKINGKGIYGSRPWKTFGEGPLKVKDGRQGENHNEFSQRDIRFTTKDGVLYAFVLAPPTKDIVIKTLAERGLLETEIANIQLMGSDEEIKWKRSADDLTITLPKNLPKTLAIGFAIETEKKPAKIAAPSTAFEYRFSDDLEQTADSQDRLDQWFRDAKFGAFIHFGVYSTLEGEYKGRGSQHRYSEWIQVSAKIPADEYHQVAARFNPSEFDADEWVNVFKRSGIRYVVITSKHHDGFALFDSMVSDYNIVDHTAFKRDIIKELSEACHRNGLKFGVYYSQSQDWDDPDAPYIAPRLEGTRVSIHPDLPSDFKPDMDRYIARKSLPQVEELVKNYELDMIWFDTPSGMNMDRVKLFSDMVRKHRPDCLINSRIIHKGKGKIEAQYLPFYDYVSIGDKEVPTRKLPLYVESPDSVSSSFGYKTKGECYYHSEEEMIHRLVGTVCAGGNYLLNNGPMGNGRLDPEAIRLYGVIGDWLKVNGDSVYETRRNPLPERPEWGDLSVSKNGKTLYLHLLHWPESGTITVNNLPVKAISALYLANRKKADFSQQDDSLTITLPAKPLDQYDTVVQVQFSNPISESLPQQAGGK